MAISPAPVLGRAALPDFCVAGTGTVVLEPDGTVVVGVVLVLGLGAVAGALVPLGVVEALGLGLVAVLGVLLSALADLSSAFLFESVLLVSLFVSLVLSFDFLVD